MHGPGHLTAAHRVEGYTIAKLKTIDAKKNAILKTKNRLIVLAHLMLSHIVPVGRLLYLTYPTNYEDPAKILYLTAERSVRENYHAATNVHHYAIPTNVCPAY